MRTDQPLDQLIRRVSHQVTRGLPVTPEDVHAAAIGWVLAESETGPLGDPDRDLRAAVETAPGAGDASAQSVCDAAGRWRDHVGPRGGPNGGPLRRLLADAVDVHRRGPRRRKVNTAAAVSIPLVCAVMVGFSFLAGRQGWQFASVLAVGAVVTVIHTAVLLVAYRRR